LGQAPAGEPHDGAEKLLPIEKPPMRDMIFSVLNDAHVGHATGIVLLPETSSSKTVLQSEQRYS